MDITIDQFITYLRGALHHLYEPDQLRHSPLAPILGVAARVDASAVLQEILMQAIEEIRPGDGDSQLSAGSMVYEVLFFRYVRGYSREAVANQLGISDRQLSREQRTAIETLALHLWKKYQLDTARADSLPPGAGGAQKAPPGEQPDAGWAGADWAKALPEEKPAPWKPILSSVMELLRPLIHENDVVVRYQPEESLPDLLVPQVALRHALLTIMSWMIPLARQADLILTPTLPGPALVITVQRSGEPFPGGPLDPGVEMARRLVERAGGSLEQVTETAPVEGGQGETRPASARWHGVRITLPTLAQIPVLVIDDNPDTIQLFQRYVQGTRYTIVGLQEPAEALRLVEAIKPRILLIDVMMPELDGWDLLTRIRLNRLLRNAGILICSILPQESLARSLGADGFLQKPVLPQDFLHALDRLMERLSQEPDNS